VIYLDFAATTKPSREVLEIFAEVNNKFWANPDSMHGLGIKANAVLEHSKKMILESFNASSEYKLIFTSSASESNNVIIKNFKNSQKKHIISSPVEHPSIMEHLFSLKKEGFEVEFLPINESGMISVENLKNSVRNDTLLVSLMQINNEMGAINNVFEIAKEIKKINKTTIFHSDFSQSVGKTETRLDNSQIDFISFSGHKIECVKGIAAVIFRKNIPFSLPLLPGTANPAAAAALAKAVKTAVKDQKENYEKVLILQNILLENLRKIPQVIINSSQNSSPYIINFSLPKLKSETVLRALSEKEIYISAVSACSSKKSKESYVIKALFNDEKRASSSLRVSLSKDLSKNDVLKFVEELQNIVSLL
jgi:cysteine desulfurase